MEHASPNPKPQDKGPFEIKKFKCLYTHDTSGKPLPKFILNGSVAYVPMTPKVWPKRQTQFTA